MSRVVIPNGWATAPGKAGTEHVVPVFDVRPHTEGSDCWCRPDEDPEYPGLWKHRSADQRETHEQGRKMH